MGAGARAGRPSGEGLSSQSPTTGHPGPAPATPAATQGRGRLGGARSFLRFVGVCCPRHLSGSSHHRHSAICSVAGTLSPASPRERPLTLSQLRGWRLS